MEYQCRGSGYAVIGKILMMQISIQIDADFERKSWSIDAEGSGDAVIGRILMHIDAVVR